MQNSMNCTKFYFAFNIFFFFELNIFALFPKALHSIKLIIDIEKLIKNWVKQKCELLKKLETLSKSE